MKKITYLFILFLGIAFTGCQEEKGFLFQDVTRISFSPKEAGNYEMTYSSFGELKIETPFICLFLFPEERLTTIVRLKSCKFRDMMLPTITMTKAI